MAFRGPQVLLNSCGNRPVRRATFQTFRIKRLRLRSALDSNFMIKSRAIEEHSADHFDPRATSKCLSERAVAGDERCPRSPRQGDAYVPS
jgi:hypothetical protein